MAFLLFSNFRKSSCRTAKSCKNTWAHSHAHSESSVISGSFRPCWIPEPFLKTCKCKVQEVKKIKVLKFINAVRVKYLWQYFWNLLLSKLEWAVMERFMNIQRLHIFWSLYYSSAVFIQHSLSTIMYQAPGSNPDEVNTNPALTWLIMTKEKTIHPPDE